PRRRENSTSTRCPRSGWNGCVMTTKAERSLEDPALCRFRGKAEGAELPVLFRDIDAAGRGEPGPLVPHQLDDLVDRALGHAIGGSLAGAWRHRPLVGVDVAIRQQVQVLVEHLPVQLRERQALPATLAENAQYHCGFLHCACLLAWCCSSPVPLRPVDRLSRSPDWPDVTPATTTGTPSP